MCRVSISHFRGKCSLVDRMKIDVGEAQDEGKPFEDVFAWRVFHISIRFREKY